MFPSKFPVLPALQMILIVAAVIAAIAITGNALALFGLLLIWSTPPVIAGDDNNNGDEVNAEGQQIGFVHDNGDQE